MAVFPVINLDNINGDGRAKILEQIEDACQNWGFFEVIHFFYDNLNVRSFKGSRDVLSSPGGRDLDFLYYLFFVLVIFVMGWA